MNEYSNHFQNAQSFQIESNHHMLMTRNAYQAVDVSLSEIGHFRFVYLRYTASKTALKFSNLITCYQTCPYSVMRMYLTFQFDVT